MSMDAPLPLEGTHEYQHLPLLSRSLRIKSIKIIFKLFLDNGYFEMDGTQQVSFNLHFLWSLKWGGGGR